MATEAAKRWTLEELHGLPDDGNKYEVVRGELFVTPPPSEGHEDVLARLGALLVPYVVKEGLGRVYHPRSVVRFDGSEVEPDLMVRQPRRNPGSDWDDAPTPSLIVEVLSDSTRQRDRVQKRAFYLDAGVGEYWIIDAKRREMRVVRRGVEDLVVTGEVTWQPPGVATALTFALTNILDD